MLRPQNVSPHMHLMLFFQYSEVVCITSTDHGGINFGFVRMDVTPYDLWIIQFEEVDSGWHGSLEIINYCLELLILSSICI